MHTPTLTLKHVALTSPERCAGCGAEFIAAEDSGSRVFTLAYVDEPGFSALLCGGCHSRWTHGVALTVRHTRD
jgi:hypothetical protein